MKKTLGWIIVGGMPVGLIIMLIGDLTKWNWDIIADVLLRGAFIGFLGFLFITGLKWILE